MLWQDAMIMRMMNLRIVSIFILLSSSNHVSLSFINPYSRRTSTSCYHKSIIPTSSSSTTSTCFDHRHHHHRQRHLAIQLAPNNNPITTTQHSNSPSTTTSLSLSSTTPEDSSPPKNNPKPNPLLLAARLLLTRITFLKASVSRLSKKGKLFLGVPLMALTLFLGSAIRSTSSSSRTVSKPVEVPFSVFMDLAEGERNKEAASRVKKMLTTRAAAAAANRGKQGQSKKKGGVVAAGQLAPVVPSSLSLENVVIGKERISFRTTSKEDGDNPAWNRDAYTRKIYASPDLLQFLRTNNIAFRAASTKSQNAVTGLVRFVFFGAYLLFLIRMYQNVSGGGSQGNAPGKLAVGGERPLVKFEDIEGIDKAKFEVMELVDTLRNPQKYAILGARAPKGLLLVGPPGTGKTMLARATAATAGVPLLYCSGSDFVEMFVGRGAARVRKTFSRASKLAPCIIFIDELDALGKSRETPFGNSMKLSNSNDEAEQTLNQLLACMDGLDSTQGVCVLAATNRREVLDPALTRPGRFDRIVTVELPDTKGREKILRLYASKLPGFTEGQGVDDSRMGSLGKGSAVDLSAVASVTNGLSGAELDVIVNEAAIRAVRRVGRALREGTSGETMVRPSVMAVDFEESVAHFYSTRGGGKGGMGKLFETVLGNK